MEHQLPPLIIPGFIVKKPISHTAMVLYGLIFSLQREEGYAYASNAYYAESLNLSIASVKRYLKELTEARLILIHLHRKAPDNVQRKIFLHSSIAAFREAEREALIGSQEGGWLKSEPCNLDTTRDTTRDTSKSSSSYTRKDLAEKIEPIYSAYPRKLGKQLGIDRLARQNFTEERLADFKKAVDNYSAYCKQQKTEEKFILHFSTFVGRWKDWLDTSPGTVAKQTTISSVTDLQAFFAPKKWKETNEN